MIKSLHEKGNILDDLDPRAGKITVINLIKTNNGSVVKKDFEIEPCINQRIS